MTTTVYLQSFVLIGVTFLCGSTVASKFIDFAAEPHELDQCRELERFHTRGITFQCYGLVPELRCVHMRAIFDEEIYSNHTDHCKREVANALEDTLQTEMNITAMVPAEELQRCKRIMWLATLQITRKQRELNFNDPWYRHQWYCKHAQTPGMNIENAWKMGYTGKGVAICILDDGIDYRHPDLIKRYRADLSYDFNDMTDGYHDPMPSTFDGRNSHGTKCAGVAAAEGHNGVCGVGAAHGAFIAGHRVLDGVITSLTEGRCLAYKNSETHIKSMSWGPMDNGASMEKPGIFSLRALENGVSKGRNGRGTIFVWASGNGGRLGDHCGADAYVSNPNVLAIGSVNQHGKLPFFTEYCPAVLAVAYTGGNAIRNGSWDQPIGCVTTDVLGKCSSSFVGTSAAAPLAAGIIALVLEANPNLSYRDVMHIITQTSRMPGLKADSTWKLNGAGYLVSDHYGFGVLDAARMIEMAKCWENVGPRYYCDVRGITFDQDKGLIVSGGSFTAKISIEACPRVAALEHVVVYLTIDYPSRGEIQISVTSPMGTTSTLLEYRPNDDSTRGIRYFPFMTTHCWGESPIGDWIIEVTTKSQFEHRLSGAVRKVGMRLFGTRRWKMDRFLNTQKEYISV